MSNIKRLKEVMFLARTLGWTYPPHKTDYPLMQLSEVEKCMLAMVDDHELEQMRKWVESDTVGVEKETKKCRR